MASLIFDLPQPLGPTMAAIPSPLKRSSVRSQNDLKPCTSTRLSFSKALPRGFGGSCRPEGAKRGRSDKRVQNAYVGETLGSIFQFRKK